MNRHGEISCIWENDILIITVTGAFNEQAIEYYGPILAQEVLGRANDNWKRIELWDNEALGCPKTLALAKDIYDWYEANGCISTAVVVANALQSHIIKDIFQSSAEIFFNEDKAMAWIKTL